MEVAPLHPVNVCLAADLDHQLRGQRPSERVTTQIEAFGQKFKESEIPDLQKKLTELRTSLIAESETYAKKLVAQAEQLIQDGQRNDAIKKLKDAKPGLQGFPGYDKVDEKLRSLQ